MTTRTKPPLKTLAALRAIASVAILTAAPLLSSAQAPPGAPPPPFDPKALQAALEAFEKVPDTAGTGKYPAIKETVASLPDHVIYRPADLSGLGREKLGVLAWGNGGCAADGAGARLHLEEIASHGYLAIANGKILTGPGSPPHSPGGFPGGGPPASGAHPAAGGPTPPFSIPPPATQAEGLRQAINWALAENTRAGSPYFGRINPNWVAVSGWSCGGLQALEIAADPRVHTAIIHSSGIFNAGANAIPGMTITKAALKKLHTPILYILGGPKDIAYANGMDDFKQIDTVPVMVANLDVGHGGTFMEPNGGLEASVAVSWLDWQLKGNAQAAQRFVGPDCGLCKEPLWTVERKRIAPAR
jgi:dienelactone hydrolase